jgi:hypothetical protein
MRLRSESSRVPRVKAWPGPKASRKTASAAGPRWRPIRVAGFSDHWWWDDQRSPGGCQPADAVGVVRIVAVGEGVEEAGVDDDHGAAG